MDETALTTKSKLMVKVSFTLVMPNKSHLITQAYTPVGRATLLSHMNVLCPMFSFSSHTQTDMNGDNCKQTGEIRLDAVYLREKRSSTVNPKRKKPIYFM